MTHASRSFPLSKLLSLFTIGVLGLLLFASAVQAASLTEKKVRSFVDSLQSAQALADEHPEVYENDAKPPQSSDLSRMFSSSLKELDKHPGVREKLVDIVQDHGFDDLDEWGSTGDRIYMAVMALEMEKDSAVTSGQMEQALAQMENDPNMSEAQKARAREMMSGVVSAFGAADNVPEADKAAVRPYLDELGASGDDN